MVWETKITETTMHIAINFNKLKQHLYLLDEEKKQLLTLKGKIKMLMQLNCENVLFDMTGARRTITSIERLIEGVTSRKEYLEHILENFTYVSNKIDNNLEEMRLLVKDTSF